jgi:hypothetical protein
MRYLLRTSRFALLAGIVTGFSVFSATAGAKASPPNWKGSATGSTMHDVALGADVDQFSGKSSHLGQFNGEGAHYLNYPNFAGKATWTASNGDSLNVTYTGVIYLTGDTVYPFGFVGVLLADGGTGRLSHAKGSAMWMGAFTGVPGNFFFDFEGTLDPNGK